MHTNLGSVYSSQAIRRSHEQYNIKHSMVREGTPADHAIIAATNGWIKKDVFLRFVLATVKDVLKSPKGFMFIT